MFGAAQPHPFCAKVPRNAAVVRCFGIGADLHPPGSISPDHECREIARELGLHRCHRTNHDFARRAVDGQDVAFADFAGADTRNLCLGVDAERSRTRNAGPPHAARDDSRVAGHAAACRKNTLRRVHPVDVFRRCLGAHKYDTVAHFGPLFGGIAVEHRNS